MSTAVTSAPPVRCAPWCQLGDGHPKQWHVDDQWCWSEEVEVPLADPESHLEVFTRRDHGPERDRVVMYLRLDDRDVDIDPQMTPGAARELAIALLNAADRIDGLSR